MAMNPPNVPPPGEPVVGPATNYGPNAYAGNMSSATVPEAAVPGATMAAPRDMVRWGPIWAGLFATLLTFLVLETLMVGLGVFTPTTTGATGNTTAAGWITAIVALIAFFVGGWVSGITSSVRGPAPGIINGLMVWGLGVGLILLLSLFGLSTIFGALGSIAGQFYNSGHPITLPITPSGASSAAQTAGWISFIMLVLTGLVSAAGGWLATRTEPIWTARPRTAPTYRRNVPA